LAIENTLPPPCVTELLSVATAEADTPVTITVVTLKPTGNVVWCAMAGVPSDTVSVAEGEPRLAEEQHRPRRCCS
jgi:hypothetical protein